MTVRYRAIPSSLTGLVSLLCLSGIPLAAQAPFRFGDRVVDLRQIRPVDRIAGPIDDEVRVTLPGNRHPMARPEYDAGGAPPETRMERMMLLLEPAAAQQEALEALLAAQQDAESPMYHQWLTPESFGALFGVSGHDLAQVVGWLEGQGFEVEPVAESRRLVVFSGTAGQVQSAFRTEMRLFRVDGELHHANARDPQIPRALEAVVAGVVSLNDFHSQPQHVVTRREGDSSPQYTIGASHYLAPADFAVIYDVNPLYAGLTDGTGQSIAVVGRTNIKLSDVQTFRSLFGLPARDPVIVLNGADPGIVSNAEQTEAQLDVEWAGAVARNATVQFVVSGSTAASDGVTLSAQYVVNHRLAPVVSVSFGSCEAAMGATQGQLWNALWQQAAAQGMSVFVASGDSGVAGCDSPSSTYATGGRSVNGLCSSPYSTCVGGTQFSDAASPSVYWSAASNPATYASALSYIPEAAWNESASVAGGSGLWSSGGGASIRYAKPAWQAGTGVPADGYRDVPDASLSSAGHDAYLVRLNGSFYGVAGTSAATPAFASLAALVAEKQGAWLGNVNPSLYTLASKQATGGAKVFHDITVGNNTVPGVSGYSAGVGYDAATGLGSVDASVLANSWRDGATALPSFQLAASRTAVPLVQGTSGTVTLTVSVSGGFQSAVSLSSGSLPVGLTAAFAPASFPSPGLGSSTLTLSAGAQMAANTYALVITASGGGVNQTVPLSVTVTSKCTYSLNAAAASQPAAGGNGSVTVTTGAGCTWTAVSGATWIAVTAGASGNGTGQTTYSVAANTSSARSGSETIAGQAFSVTQAGATAATFSLNPASASFAAAGGAGTVSVLAPSASSSWTAVSNAAWIAITSGSSGAGSKTVTYSVAANTASASRTGSMTIAGLSFAVTQSGSGCSYAVSPGPLTPGAAGFTGSFSVLAPAGCAWTATANVTWISITAGASGTGNGTVKYAAAANTTGSPRSATLVVAGYGFLLTEGVQASAGPVAPVRASP